MTLPAFDPTDPAFVADPYPAYRLLRTHAPVVWVEALHSWVVSRHADVLHGLRDPRMGINLGNETAFRFAGGPAAFPALADMFRRQILFRDPPEHTRVRALIAKAFTPRVVGQLRASLTTLIDGLLARGGEMDVIADFAFPLPVTVIALLLGVPAQDHAKFKAWSHPISLAVEPAVPPDHVAAAASASGEMMEYFRALVAKKRSAPGDDLLSALIQAEEQGQRLTTDELLANAVLVLVAGHETTVNLIGNGVLALLRHPDQLAALRADAGLIDNAVEEILRYDSPVQILSRFARQDVTVGGQAVASGQEVLFLLGSANRDEAVFRDPDRLDVAREGVQSLSFGGGPHYCLGAPLARLEAEMAIGALVKRFEKWELMEEPPRRASATLRGVASLRVRFRS